MQQGQSQESPNSFRGRQPINNQNILQQRNQRPKSLFTNRNRNTLPPRKSSTQKIRTQQSSSAINDPALRNRQRSRSRLRTRPVSSISSSNNRVHPFSTTTEAPVVTTPTTLEASTTRFDLQSTLDLEDILPIILSEATEPPIDIEQAERFPDQPVQNTFVTRARAPIERLIPTTIRPRTLDDNRGRRPDVTRAQIPVERLRPTKTTSAPFSKIKEPEYNDYYEYYDEEQDQKSFGIAHPSPVKSIDDYDLFPLNNKVNVV